MKLKKPLAIALAPVVGVAATLVGMSPATAATQSQTFEYSGKEETFTVPAGVSVMKIVALGGSGSGFSSSVVGGSGARVTSYQSVTAGEVLKIRVGSVGDLQRTGGAATAVVTDSAALVVAGGGGGSTLGAKGGDGAANGTAAGGNGEGSDGGAGASGDGSGAAAAVGGSGGGLGQNGSNSLNGNSGGSWTSFGRPSGGYAGGGGAGFGGGGGGQDGAGGGGYGGGAGGGTNSAGGAGGSYAAPTEDRFPDTVFAPGDNPGSNGQVVLEWEGVTPGPGPNPGPNPDGKPVKPRSLKVAGKPAASKFRFTWKAPKTGPVTGYWLTIHQRGKVRAVVEKKRSKRTLSYSISRKSLIRHALKTRGEIGSNQFVVRVRTLGNNTVSAATAKKFKVRLY